MTDSVARMQQQINEPEAEITGLREENHLLEKSREVLRDSNRHLCARIAELEEALAKSICHICNDHLDGDEVGREARLTAENVRLREENGRLRKSIRSTSGKLGALTRNYDRVVQNCACQWDEC